MIVLSGICLCIGILYTFNFIVKLVDVTMNGGTSKVVGSMLIASLSYSMAYVFHNI